MTIGIKGNLVGAVAHINLPTGDQGQVEKQHTAPETASIGVLQIVRLESQ